ncbi:bifunctional riboflavin kinase/FAD synthetase [Paenibacillus glycanilyticus]|uniref:Riboflavin biosynthesis protein n=1 Tax=Paenibacillus glycanilyticus TaxID=126569 RepID=A0ABQ6GEL4_9BACL|nr:bifunctional riboflavin kinase/FAD synthetase [Paenibacillus glycanilyticus]GLX68530.1 riboflavin biosynthesis protein RibC [Paenibacillus glycanilyticus]
MEIISLTYPLQECPAVLKDKKIAVAIGHFDGVHRGHQNVIRQAVQIAKQSGALSAVMTFLPHPKEVLGQGDQYFSCLTPPGEKQALFAELGVDIMIVVKFDLTFAAISPQQFVDEVLRPLHAEHVVVGFDFTFGSKGQGNPEMMRTMGSPDIKVDIVDPLYENGEKVSSTYIRSALEKGDIALATTLLGRPYELDGIVVHGDARGRTIGFPTANVGLSKPFITPCLGVFAIKAKVAGKTYSGVLNHGMKPTFNKEEIRPVLEAHLFDFHQDIYGEPISLEFHSFIRPEKKFGSVHELIEQIGADAKQAKQFFGLA